MSDETRAASPGARDALVIAAVAVFVLRGDRLLALKRSVRKDAAPGAWDVVSGRIEPDEHPYDAAVREAREETGLALAPDPSPVVAYTAQRLGRPMLVVGYRAACEHGDVVISHEHDDHAWMTIDEFARACPFPLLVEAARRAMAARPAAAPPTAASTTSAAYVIVWEFEVRSGREAEFEAAYGPEGDWARLFRQGAGYRGTELLRASERRYVTVDRWAARDDFERFRDAHREEYDAIDRRCEDLTVSESPLGRFVSVR